jgi:hypothetical protein
MSAQERQELEALTVWLETFSQIQQALKKHGAGPRAVTSKTILEDPDIAR